MFLIEIIGVFALTLYVLYFRMPSTARVIVKWNIRVRAPRLSSGCVLVLGIVAHLLGDFLLHLPSPSFSPTVIESARELERGALVEVGPVFIGRIVAVCLLVLVPLAAVYVLIRRVARTEGCFPSGRRR